MVANAEVVLCCVLHTAEVKDMSPKQSVIKKKNPNNKLVPTQRMRNSSSLTQSQNFISGNVLVQ